MHIGFKIYRKIDLIDLIFLNLGEVPLKLERSNVDFPLWRKKVDSSLFRENGTTIPQWACTMWGIQKEFHSCISRKDSLSNVKVEFNKREYAGWVTVAKKGRKTPAYRLWYSEQLSYELKDVFLMSFARDIENRLRKSSGDKKPNIEDKIPFWEFLDIEYESEKKRFYFKAYYIQKPAFTELFRRLIKSPILHKIDDELQKKPPFRIYKRKWKPRDELEFELGANNVLYFLIDTKNKLLYIGEASNLVDRLRQDHPSIPKWDFFRYNILPDKIAPNRKTFERMAISDFANIFDSKNITKLSDISEFRLVNKKIDTI